MTALNPKIPLVKAAQRWLKISDPDYRYLLSSEFNGALSAKSLSEHELDRLLALFRKRGWKESKTRGRRMTQDQLLETVLSEGGYDSAYADSIAKRLAGVDSVRWCSKQQKAAVIAAIIRDNQRKGKGKAPKPKGRPQ